MLDYQWCCFCPNNKMPKSCQCREGLYALPKTMFDKFCKVYKRRKNSFNSLILDISQRLGHFLREGIKPSPTSDMRIHLNILASA